MQVSITQFRRLFHFSVDNLGYLAFWLPSYLHYVSQW